MGAVLQTAGAAELAAELTCCACSSVCGLITRDSATRAKFRYCSFLLIATVTCVILLIPRLRYKLDRIPAFCSKTFSSDTCDKFVGFAAVYRILTALAMFHFILAVLTVRVTRVNSYRAKFNNGLWFFKMGLIFGLTVFTFYIPKKTGFFRVWMYISMTAGFMFIMFQIMLIIDFGHSWSLSWAEKLETGYTKLWYLAMAVVTLFMFSLSAGALIAFYTYFTHAPNFHKCHANVFYISFVGVQCVLAALVSVTPSVQQELTGAGLLQSSVVILYTMYLTWNTLSSEPDSTCNPLGNIILEYDSLTGVSGEAIFGCMITMVLLLFACTVRANTSHLGKYGLALAESEAFALSTYQEDKSRANVEKRLETGEKEVSLGEYVGYNYSFFHIIMSIAALYILMVLTNWHSPEENSDLQRLVKNWASVWAQMASSFVCILIYIWFLVTPLIKRVWGPTFGVILDEDYYHRKQERKVHTPRTLKNDKQRIFNNESKHFEVQNLTVENVKKLNGAKRSSSRNTFKADRLTREPSQESIISAVSFVSNVTAVSRKSKLMTKLYAVHEQRALGVPDKIVLSRINSTRDKGARVNAYDENESIYSDFPPAKKDEYVERRSVKIRKPFKQTPQEITHREPDATQQTSNPQQSSETDKTEQESPRDLGLKNRLNESQLQNKQQHLEKHSRQNLEQQDRHPRQSLDHQDKQPRHGLENQGKQPRQNLEHQENDGDTTENDDVVSIVPSVFKKKEQDPETAKEILKLQWKILRTQAKVVKVQERIMRLQRQTELNAGIAEFPPACQSSVVDYNNKYLMNKEHG